jgi:putative MATE family efflux protein
MPTEADPQPAVAAPMPAHPPAAFTIGSTLRHVIVMSATGAIGLVAIFAVDLLSLLYISWLGDVNLTAGVGYASTVLFIPTSINVGLMIAIGALVSRALGARERDRARRLSASSLVHMTILSGAIGLVILALTGPLLDLMGAKGEAREVAFRFLEITMPANVLLGIGMGMSALLRAVGDARRAMYVTLAGGIATALIDPVLIFGLGWGVTGAAITTVISRLVFCLVGVHGAVRVHDMVGRPRALETLQDLRPMMMIALPAILTNVATPVANTFMTAVMSPFGDGAVAANAIMSRLAPVAFGALFALSGAIGPILGQNLGARQVPRVKKALRDSLIVSLITTLAAWALLFVGQDAIVAAFAATGETAELVRFFCTVIAGTWLFHGALFVANAAFNNLGAPLMATGFNWLKATLGTMPVAWIGAKWGGPEGALLGQGIGAVAFGILGLIAAFSLIERLAREHAAPPASAKGSIATLEPTP